MKKTSNLNILIAPLDWGLGHITRCIPIIHFLQDKGCRIFVACDNKTKAIYENEFNNIIFIPFKGYSVSYFLKNNFILSILLQIPKILSAIRNENKYLNTIVYSNNIHAIISDNRYGCYHKKVYSVFMTHQLCIKSGMGKWVDKWLKKINFHLLKKFDEVWIPDFEGETNFAGELSHPYFLPEISIKYLGILSRFEKAKEPILYNLMILLSGPEPERTNFEKIILDQLKNYKEKVLLIRGLPDEINKLSLNNNILALNHISANQLNKYILQSKYIICRSGYTTIMDLVKLSKTAILVPTPGQTEQEYLADYLSKKGLFVKLNQKNFDLIQAILNTENFTRNESPSFLNFDSYKIYLNDFMEKIKEISFVN